MPPGEVKSVVTVHDCIYEENVELALLLDPFDNVLQRKRRCIQNAATIIVPSRATEAALAKHYPGLTCVVHVVPEGVATQLTPPRRPLAIANSRWARRHPEESRPYLLHVGGRGHYKDFGTLLSAFADPSLCQEFDLVVVGSESEPRPDEESPLARVPSEGRIVWLGQVPDAQLSALYAGAAAVVSVSTIEGFGLPVLEAAALGTPVACTRIPAYVETVGAVAEMFEPQDVAGCAQAIRAAVDLPREPLLEFGRELSITFSWRRMAVQVQTIYEGMVD
jgi:glycosyltransferase involved in cell wall biosynthesis